MFDKLTFRISPLVSQIWAAVKELIDEVTITGMYSM